MNNALFWLIWDYKKFLLQKIFAIPELKWNNLGALTWTNLEMLLKKAIIFLDLSCFFLSV